ncbi:hypothetical protein ROZALSC1DRAFT_32079, partial [Rozella allomycis CSF55]
ALYKHYDPSLTIGDCIVKHLPETFSIIDSSSNIENRIIVEFVMAGVFDSDLPLEEDDLVKNLKWSPKFTQNFLLAQSALLAESFKEQKYKILGQRISVPFVLDASQRLRGKRSLKGTVLSQEKLFPTIMTRVEFLQKLEFF